MHLLLRRPRSSVPRGASLHGKVGAVNQFLVSLAACLLKNKFGLRGDVVRNTTMPPRVINNPLPFQFGENIKVSFRFSHFRLMKMWHRHHGTHVTMTSLQMHRGHGILVLRGPFHLRLPYELHKGYSYCLISSLSYQSLCTLAITGSQLHTLVTCLQGQKVCFLFWQLLKPDGTPVGCNWLADKRERVLLARQVTRYTQTHCSPEAAGPR